MRGARWQHPALWVGSLMLLALSALHRGPYLFAVRGIITPLLLGLALGALIAALRLGAPGRARAWSRRLLLAMLGAAILLTVADDHAFQQRRAGVLAGSDALRAVGAHFIVGFSTFDEMAALARQGLIGGIYLGRNYARQRTASRIREEISELQALRSAAGLPPLLIAADQEGGQVAHMSPPLEAMPALSSLVAAGPDSGLEQRARRYGTTQGRALARLGINLNFGPVADLRPAGRGPAFDTHTLLTRRAISSDPAVVARVATAYGDGLRSAGVLPTLKHFPGLGRTRADTHHFATRLEVPLASLRESDWLPFRDAAERGNAIMLAHVTLPAIDALRPASLSRAVVQDLLRRDWQHDGLLITDDLNMGAVFRDGVCRTAVEALQAGVDLVLISYDPDQYFEAAACAAAAQANGSLDNGSLADSRRRIEAATRTVHSPGIPQEDLSHRPLRFAIRPAYPSGV